MSTLDTFYQAFARGDHAAMGGCYHPSARFSDPVFPDLDAAGARAMWRMLLTSGSPLRITHEILEQDGTQATVRWQAWYTFSRTKRPVHNVITSHFTLKDGLILTQRDRFDFWRWSRQALGLGGLLLGWTPLVRNKVRAIAASNLRKATAA